MLEQSDTKEPLTEGLLATHSLRLLLAPHGDRLKQGLTWADFTPSYLPGPPSLDTQTQRQKLTWADVYV